MECLFAHLDVHALPPTHVIRLLQKVVTHPTRDWHYRGVLVNELFLPPDLHKHALHLIRNLIVARLLVSRSVAIHLVHAHAHLLHTQQIDQSRVLASLALDLTRLVVTLCDGGCEVAVSGHHDEGHVGLRGAGDHVLDEITMARRINDGIVPLLGEELFSGARNGDTALAF